MEEEYKKEINIVNDNEEEIEEKSIVNEKKGEGEEEEKEEEDEEKEEEKEEEEEKKEEKEEKINNKDIFNFEMSNNSKLFTPINLGSNNSKFFTPINFGLYGQIYKLNNNLSICGTCDHLIGHHNFFMNNQYFCIKCNSICEMKYIIFYYFKYLILK
mgnify:CR=1 FL=1